MIGRMPFISGSSDKPVMSGDSIPVDDDLPLWLIKRLRAPIRPASALEQGKFWAESTVTNF
jgi:hypothetical protein